MSKPACIMFSSKFNFQTNALSKQCFYTARKLKPLLPERKESVERRMFIEKVVK